MIALPNSIDDVEDQRNSKNERGGGDTIVSPPLPPILQISTLTPFNCE